MNALISAWPRRGSCREYFSSMSGAAISSTIWRSQLFPQQWVNQVPTTSLLSSCLLLVEPGPLNSFSLLSVGMLLSLIVLHKCHAILGDDLRDIVSDIGMTSDSCPRIEIAERIFSI